jgi:L-fuculose-phosphate aldolase
VSEALRAELAETYRALGRLGLIVASSGNVSARVAGGMLISPTGARADSITPDQLVAMDLAGVAGRDLAGVTSGHLLPSSEWHMHAAIYQAVPAAGAVVHTHSDAATALACLNRDLPPFHYMLAEFGGNEVRCAPYVTFGTPELADLAVQALGHRTACLLANHGMICHGPTPQAALLTAQRLEALARQYLLACSVGTPRLLSEAEMAAAHLRYRSYGQQPGDPT